MFRFFLEFMFSTVFSFSLKIMTIPSCCIKLAWIPSHFISISLQESKQKILKKTILIFPGYLTIDGGFLTVYHSLLIYSNFHLFFFLSSQTEKNMALNVVDKKKERKRNFVNAKTGMICAFWLPVHLILYSTLYGLKVNMKL